MSRLGITFSREKRNNKPPVFKASCNSKHCAALPSFQSSFRGCVVLILNTQLFLVWSPIGTTLTPYLL